jgi:hypothetical protein
MQQTRASTAGADVDAEEYATAGHDADGGAAGAGDEDLARPRGPDPGRLRRVALAGLYQSDRKLGWDWDLGPLSS